MTNFDIGNSEPAFKKLKCLMNEAEQKMLPHMDKYTSPEGLVAGVMLSGAATIVAEGKEDKKYLNSVIKSASEISGIPLSAMKALAECSLEINNISIQMQRTPPFVGSDEDE